MYRCAACDTPPIMGHSAQCVLIPGIVIGEPETGDGERMSDVRINIASGEDVQLEELACS